MQYIPRSVRARAVISAILVLFALLAAPAFSPAIHAQAVTGGVAGEVIDPDGKVVVDAVVLVRSEATSELRTTVTGSDGRFAASNLTGGLYTIEVAIPGFDIVRRTGVDVAAGQTRELPIRLTVANVSESVTVSAALPTAAVAAPSQGSLTARSAQSLISNEYIRNYTSPFSDYSQVLQMAPGTFSVSANGPGLSDTKTYFRGFQDGKYNMTFDGISTLR